MTPSDTPTLPAYGGACISNVVPALFDRRSALPAWLPPELSKAEQVVLLVLDGLGWNQLQDRLEVAPTLGGMAGGLATSVAPTTTAVALTSIATGATPGEHGIVGYRMKTSKGVLNLLRWSIDDSDASETVPPASLRRVLPFRGLPVPLVTRSEFARSGFTSTVFDGAAFVGWRSASSIAVEVGRALAAGNDLVYAYYDGIDKIAHAHGLGDHYAAELRSADRLVADLIDGLPPKAALVVTSDHGQVDVGDRLISVAPAVDDLVSIYSGEGRFLWLDALDDVDGLAKVANDEHGDHAWVRTYDDMVTEGWFGSRPDAEVRQRLGDVALVARDEVAFIPPGEAPSGLVARHGSLTEAEMLVPVVAAWR
ncbi:MAG: alkaline phosphatase family protein [Acidimicrobiales bacterium]